MLIAGILSKSKLTINATRPSPHNLLFCEKIVRVVGYRLHPPLEKVTNFSVCQMPIMDILMTVKRKTVRKETNELGKRYDEIKEAMLSTSERHRLRCR